MNIKYRRPAAFLCIAAFFAIAGPVSAQASLTPDLAALKPGDAWTAVGADNSTVLHGRPDGSTYRTFSTRTFTAATMLNPVDSFQCNVINNSGYVIRSYSPVKKLGGNTASVINLKCGTSGSGYLHITLHANEWADRVAWAGGGADWDDFMNYVVSESLTHPTRVVAQADNKSCFTTPVTIRKKSGATVTFNPTTAVSNNNKLVITSFPSTVTQCK